jgi:hypothetical protein
MVAVLFKKGMVFAIIILFVGAGVVPSISSDNSSFGNWWNYDWSYCKLLSIDSPINDYQMLINVSKHSGGNVNCSGHCKDDFGDVRFLDIDNLTVLDYWIEKIVDDSYAWFWVELSSDIETDQKILIYYGNPTATSISDGDATFLWFDDFTIDTTGDWEKFLNFDSSAWFFYNTKFNDSINSARLRSNVDCVDINSRNFAGDIFQGMKFKNNSVLMNLTGLHHSYNSDSQASETQPSIMLRNINTSGNSATTPVKIMVEGTNGYVTEWLYSYPSVIGMIWDSSNSLLWDRTTSSNTPDNLTYLYFWLTDRHAANGGSGLYTGLFYDASDEQLIVYCQGSQYSPDDSWLELHYSWMFLGKYAEPEPFILSVGVEKPVIHAIVYVDDDYDSSTPGWGYDHFDVIQDGIVAVAEGGTIYVYNGIYYENVVVDKTINLTGEDRDGTIIDGGAIGDVVYVSANWVNISGFTVQNSGGSGTPNLDAGIDLRSSYNTVMGNTITNYYK